MTADSPQISLLDAVALAGSRERPNDDRWGAAANRLWVIDGATGLGDPIMPATSDAAWFAQRVNEAFHRHAGVRDTFAMMAAVADDLAAAFVAERRRPPEADWEIPCASFLMATVRPGEIEFTGLGDCRGVVVGADGIALFGSTAESEAREAAFAAKFRQMGIAPRYRSPEALDALRKARSRFAMAEGDFVLVPDPMFLPAIKPVVVGLKGEGALLLMTDGFAALTLRYGAFDDGALLAAARKDGLAALAEALRRIETVDDPAAERFPRWKQSDDATAILATVSGA